MFVKVCGLDTVESARVAVDAGADAIGVVISDGSPRNLSVEVATEIVDAVRADVQTVLVVSDLPAAQAAETALRIGVSVLQLHGGYTSEEFAQARRTFERVWRATSLGDDTDLHVGARGEELLLLDAPRAGSGQRWDLSNPASRRPDGRWLLAGGLAPDNVAEAVRLATPRGVDVSSGVERTRGVKDHDAIRAFVAAARSVG
ncbi:phosphoribosylanthranilate isomerase [Nocardioides sp. B-3]|uniref:phosphoribosylanthranilate isomerase n=1 Tax=Nocardioides sp. B-3 TaxID=2895565 RepID=UPI0021538094|nr:phosphoribosylanthranilate isomerase [Nocardioides sp. B-3]UUZ61373.1 phosphoribosylanthranilate isomerase [Nocardioides sp. B-3]